MSLNLACQCGAAFEVNEMYLGQLVACPECRRSFRARQMVEQPVRTSGYALASFATALAAGFTYIGPLIAFFLGLLALVHIRKSQGRLVGRGFAMLGTVISMVFGGLSALMFFKGDVLDLGGRMREELHAGELIFDGPLEMIQEEDGFGITRPSRRWGLATAAFHKDTSSDHFTLVCPAKQGVIEVIPETAPGFTLATLEEAVKRNLGLGDRGGLGGYNSPPSYQDQTWRNVRLNSRREFTFGGRHRSVELVIEGRIQGQQHKAVIYLVEGEGRFYQVWANCPTKRFAVVEAEMRQCLDSFRILPLRAGPALENERNGEE